MNIHISYIRRKVPNLQFYNMNSTREIIKLIVHLKVMKNSFLVIKKKKNEISSIMELKAIISFKNIIAKILS